MMMWLSVLVWLAVRAEAGCDDGEVRSLRLVNDGPLAAEKAPQGEKRRKLLLTPFVETASGGCVEHGFAGLNNQRAVLQSLLLAARRLKTDVLFPPAVLTTPMDPEPADMIQSGACNGTMREDGGYDAPWNETWTTDPTRPYVFGPARALWDVDKYRAVASSRFGVSVEESAFSVTQECANSDAGYRHVYLAVEPVEPGKFEAFLETWRRAIQDDDRADPKLARDFPKGTVYHVNLGYQVFFGAIDGACPRVFSKKECDAALAATVAPPAVTKRSDRIVRFLKDNAAQRGRDSYDVAHFHHVYCTLRGKVLDAMKRRPDRGDTAYNVGDVPLAANGFSKADVAPNDCARLPYQANAAIEFQVALEGNGTFLGTLSSSFDTYANVYRSGVTLIKPGPGDTDHQVYRGVESGARCPEPATKPHTMREVRRAMKELRNA